jgi:DNA-binding MarR family transcriptional regulator
LPLSDSVGFMISNTGRKMSQYLTIRFQPYDVTPEQWSLLSRLAENDGISQKELAFQVDKDPTNVTRILDQLERKGLVSRTSNKEDRRSFLLFLTDQGKELDRKLAPIEDQAIREMLIGVSPADIETVRHVFTQINKNTVIRQPQ